MQHTQVIFNVHKVIIIHSYCTFRLLLQLPLDARSGTTKNNYTLKELEDVHKQVRLVMKLDRRKKN